MKNLFYSVANPSTMIEGYSFDRTQFGAYALWMRSLVSGAICVGLMGLGIYCAYIMIDPAFASALGDKAPEAKLAAGAFAAALLAYAMRDLFNSVRSDVTTEMRVARANSWLSSGTAHSHAASDQVPMQQVMLAMVRFVEIDAGIKVFVIGKSEGNDTPFLIETSLFDGEYAAVSTYYRHIADIRSRLNLACAEWTLLVAELLGIQLDTVSVAAHASRLDDDSELDDEFFGDLVPSPSGRASADSAARLNTPRTAVNA